ncbi:MAG TPA: 4Fe-4S binding protein [Candidatus Lokiarchaeia archaeon]|nr:4Fe-4S binding protein [Candidatus Lokiarchaeia archaeon]
MTRLEIVDSQRCVGCELCMLACARRQNDVGIASSCIGVQSAGGMVNGFTIIVCRACENPPCARSCPVDALSLRKGGGVILNKAKCIGCKTCVGNCILGAIFWDSDIDKPMICIHCGICAKYCPHGVLALNKMTEEIAIAQE